MTSCYKNNFNNDVASSKDERLIMMWQALKRLIKSQKFRYYIYIYIYIYILDKTRIYKAPTWTLTLWVRNSHMLWAGRYE